MENTTGLWATLKPYSLQAPLLILVLYALWHLARTRGLVKRFYEKVQFKQLTAKQSPSALGEGDSVVLESLTGWDKQLNAPTQAYSGEYRGYTISQHVAKRKRGSNHVRRKASYRTQYTVTIVSLPTPLVPFCVRPKHVLDAVDYIFDGEDIKLWEEDDFSKYYHVRGQDVDAIVAYMGDPLREMLMGVAGVSVESISQKLIFVRVRDYFEIEGNLNAELESAVEISQYLLSKARALSE